MRWQPEILVKQHTERVTVSVLHHPQRTYVLRQPHTKRKEA